MAQKKSNEQLKQSDTSELSPKEKALKLAIAAIEKDIGKESIIIGDSTIPGVDWFSSGCMSLNKALSGSYDKGYPRGRIIETFGPPSSGKTTLCLHAIAEMQKQGERAAFIDVEHSLDPLYATALGVDINTLIFSQPQNGEQALQIADKLIKSGALGLVVIDSVAALTPKAEIEGEIGDSHMGRQARLMSQAMRMLAGTLFRTNTTMMFVNQIRMKIGIMFGCFHEDTPVVFANGTQHPIREIVEKRLSGPVLSLNKETGKLENKSIINWYQNGTLNKNEQWITVSLSSVGGPGGNMSFTATPNHKIYVGQFGTKWFKEIPLSELQPGDHMISWYQQTIGNNSDLSELVLGTMLGDGCIRRRDKSTACLSLANQEQPEYISWKLDMMDELGFISAGNKDRPRFDSRYSTELSILREKFYPSKSSYRCIPRYLKLTPLSMAVWFMDDGHYKETHQHGSISIKRLYTDKVPEPKQQRAVLLKAIQELIGYEGIAISDNQKAVCFTKPAFARLSHSIAKYIPECMQYKILPEDRGQYVWSGPEKSIPTKEIIFSEVKNICTASPRKYRAKRKYDLQIQDNATYMVGGACRGVVVHNSPETTAGGNALKFYSSQRLDIRRTGGVKGKSDDEPFIANTTKVKVVKNKVAPPFRLAEFQIKYGEGIDILQDLLKVAVDSQVVEKSGSWYSYNGTRLGQGEANVTAILKEQPELLQEIQSKL